MRPLYDQLIAWTISTITVTSSRAATKPFEHSTPARKMAEMAKEIIRQYWTKRHDPNPRIREQAVNLVKTHIVMLRKWEQKGA